MLKAILLLLTLSQIAYSEVRDTTYIIRKFSHGTPYIRLTVPENSNKWTCFNEDGFQEFIYLKTDAPLKDSLLNTIQEQVDLCNNNINKSKEILNLSKENQKELDVFSNDMFDKYNKTYEELKQEKPKKFKWGGIGFLGGSIIGLVTAIMIGR